jgi:hypothetical protein
MSTESKPAKGFLKDAFERLPDILAYDAKGIFYPALLIPIVLVALGAWVVCDTIPEVIKPEIGPKIYSSEYSSWMYWFETIGGPWVTGIAAGLALVRLGIQRNAFGVWLLSLATLIFFRELHYRWVDIVIYPGLVAIFTAAWLYYESMCRYMATRLMVTLTALLLFSYFLSQSLDLRWWKFLPQENHWERPVEELLEVFGHSMMIGLVVLTRAIGRDPR